jgi:hypothetical protein
LGLSAFVFRVWINPESKGGVKMALGSDYFERILEAVENSERAYDNGHMEDAAGYMEEVRHTAGEFLEELERHIRRKVKINEQLANSLDNSARKAVMP